MRTSWSFMASLIPIVDRIFDAFAPMIINEIIGGILMKKNFHKNLTINSIEINWVVCIFAERNLFHSLCSSLSLALCFMSTICYVFHLIK